MASRDLVPRNKSDFERLQALIAASPEAAEPVLDSLLYWLQDIDWPIALPLADFLVNVGKPLIPHINKILRSNDDMWIYWVLQHVVAKLPSELIASFESQLYALATRAENDIVAIRIAASSGIWDRKRLVSLIDNQISAHADYVVELKKLKDEI